MGRPSTAALRSTPRLQQGGRLMTTPTQAALHLLAVGAFALSLSACTTKMTPNPTDTTSSTTPGAHFTQDGLLKADQKVQAFTAFNFEHLKDEVARGQGEYVTSLGTLLGVPTDRHPEFFTFAREHYPVLFTSDRTTPSETVAALNQELSADPVLGKVLARH
ncbi:MAG: DUF3015 domain-containing protein [Nitrospirae bacterium]|nr:MAG: DUF3015 domain-containing protein [Nitrospirota bacterium]